MKKLDINEELPRSLQIFLALEEEAKKEGKSGSDLRESG